LDTQSYNTLIPLNKSASLIPVSWDSEKDLTIISNRTKFRSRNFNVLVHAKVWITRKLLERNNIAVIYSDVDSVILSSKIITYIDWLVKEYSRSGRIMDIMFSKRRRSWYCKYMLWILYFISNK